MKNSPQYFIGRVNKHGFDGITGEPFADDLQAVKEARRLSLETGNLLSKNPPKTVECHFLVIGADSADDAAAWMNNPENAQYLDHLKTNLIYEGVRITGPEEKPPRMLIVEKN